MDIRGSEWFPRTPEQAAELYQRHVSGRYSSNWNLIAAAAGSSLGAGLARASEMLNTWVESRKRRQDGETRVVALFNYKSIVVGPLLGCVVLSAMSIESFVRLVREISLVLGGERAESHEAALKKFENRSSLERVTDATEAAGANQLPDDLRDAIAALIAFRNDCAHDSPRLQLNTGQSAHYKWGKPRIIDETQYAGMYPVLDEHPIPLSPRHAAHAVQTHDKLVAHINETASAEFANALDVLQVGHLLPILTAVPVSMDTYTRAIDDWDGQFIPWFDSVPMEAQEACYREFIRRTFVKPVD